MKPFGPQREHPASTPSRRAWGWWVGLVAAMILLPAITLGVALRMLPALASLAGGPHDAQPPSATMAPARREAPVRGAGVAGRVLDGDGEPAAGARVRVVGRSGTAILRALVADAEGRFSVDGLPPGAAQVMADHGDRGAVASAPLELVEGVRAGDVVLTLQAGRAVHGRVVDEEGRPVAGALVAVDGLPWLSRSTHAGDDGSFTLVAVPGEARALQAEAQGFATQRVALAAGDAPAAARDPGTASLVIRLRRAVDVEGVVLDPSGAPSRAMVTACGGNDEAHRVASGADGVFRFPAAMAGCPLIASHDGFEGSEEVKAEAGARLVLRLRAGGSIAGVIVDDDGAPVPRFSLGVESFTPSSGERDHSVRSGFARAFDDPGGAFVLERLAPGSYVLSASIAGAVPVRSRSIDVHAGKATTGVKIVLARGGVVEGQVADAETRRPVEGARVSFDATTSMHGAQGVAPVVTGPDGRFRLEGAPTGRFSLRVEQERYGVRIVAGLRVASRQTLRHDVTLSAAGDAGPRMSLGGVGASLWQTRDGIVFQAVFEGSPAARAGVAQGDLLRGIDGDSVEGMSVADAIQALRGEPGTVVRVALVRPGGGAFDATIVRAEITR